MSALTEVRAVLNALDCTDITTQRRLALLKQLPELVRDLADAYEDLTCKVEEYQNETKDLRRSLGRITGDPRWIDPGPIILAALTEAGAVVR